MCCLGRRKIICLGPNAPFDPLAYQANRSSDQTIGFLTVLSNHYFISSPHLTLLSSLDETSFEPGGKSARHQAFNLFEQPQLQCQWQVVTVQHRDKTRVQMLAKNAPHLKLLLCLLFMGPTLCFDTKQGNIFLIKIGVFLNNKSKILIILFIVKYAKIILFDVFLVLLGPIISRFFACSNKEK